MHNTSGTEIAHMMIKLPITVTILVMMWITSADKLVETTSMS